MSTVGWSTLDVIPSVKGMASELDRQTRGQFATAGRRAGQQFGDAASREAGGRLKSGLKSAFAPAAGILAGLGGVRIFGDMIAEAQESVKVGRISEALIKSTGGAANLSANQVGDLANAMSKYAAVDDEVVQGAENVLLTFKAVRNEAGKGNDIFTRATKAGLDLSTVLDGDLKGAALQLGKALQDPTKGITALARAGVSFTASQKEQIKGLVASNDLLSAQKLILDEVERQVGGAAGANATQLDRLSVSFKNLEEAAGLAAAPALDAFAKVATNQVIPGLENAGGATADVARAFDDLPGPVKAAAGAFVALRLASAAGIGTTLAAGVTSATSAMASLRIRAMFAADAYRSVAGSSAAATAANGRLAGSMAAVGAASQGAGAKMAAFGRAVGPIAAVAASFAILDHFKPDDVAIGRYVEKLQALAGPDIAAQIDEINKALAEQKKIASDTTGPTFHVFGATVKPLEFGTEWQTADEKVRVLKDQLAELKHQQELNEIASKRGATATGEAARANQSYATQLDNAKDAILGLLDVENKRRNAQLTIRQDRLALIQQEQAAREEAAKGARTLDENTKAGQENQQALFDLASQWNNSAESVKNAKGAYADLRKNFIDIAVSMGDSRTKAQKLADEILNVPRRLDTEVRTPGMKQALRDLAELRAQLRAIHNFKGERFVFSVQAANNQAALSDIHRAGGGPIYGPGSGTSDSILMWGSNGEFMQRKAAVDYYGLDYMRRLNNLQVPKFAGGGPIGGGGGGGTHASVLGHEIRGTLAIDRDGIAYIRGVVRSEIDAANRAGRGASDRNRRSGLRP